MEADVAKGKAEAAKGGVFGEDRAPAQGTEKGYNLCSNAALSEIEDVATVDRIGVFSEGVLHKIHSAAYLEAF